MSKTKREKLLALIVSFITNPVFTLGFALYVSNSTLVKAENESTVVFIIINFSLPIILYIYHLIGYKEHWTHYAAISQRQRDVIFLSAIFSSLVSTILFLYTQLNIIWVYNSMLLMILFSIYYLINKYIDKISIHASIFTFSIIYLTDKNHVFFSVLLALLPIICWSRIKLHKHSWFQLGLGVILGMFIGILSWTF